MQLMGLKSWDGHYHMLEACISLIFGFVLIMLWHYDKPDCFMVAKPTCIILCSLHAVCYLCYVYVLLYTVYIVSQKTPTHVSTY